MTTEKVGFRRHLSHTKLLTSITYELKQLLSYVTHRMTLLWSQQPFSACLSVNWRFWLVAVLQNSNNANLSNKRKVEVLMCAYSACTVHMQTHFPQNVTVRLKFSVHCCHCKHNLQDYCGAVYEWAPLLPRDDDNH